MENLKWTLLPATEFSLRQDEWASLNDRSERHVLLRPDFIQSCLEHFADADTYLAVGHDKFQAVAAMALLRRLSPFTWATFSPPQLPVTPLVARPDYSLATICPGLVSNLPLPTLILSLEHLDPALFPQPSDNRQFISLPYIETCEISVPGSSWPAYFDTLPTPLVGNIRRRRNKAAREYSSVTLDVITDKAGIDDAVDIYADLESSGWKSNAGTALKRGDSQTTFYKVLLEKFSEQGQGAVLVLRFGETVAAARFLIWDDCRVVMLKTAYNETLRAYAPGQLLFFDTLAWLAENHPHITRVETYGPANELQRSFATGSRQLYHLNIYRMSAMKMLHAWKMERASAARASEMEKSLTPPEDNSDPHAISLAGSPSDIGRSNSQQTDFFATREWFELFEKNVLSPTRTAILLPHVKDQAGNGLFLPLISKKGKLLSAANYYSGLYAAIRAGDGVDIQTFVQAFVRWLRDRKAGFLRLYPVDQSDPLVSNLSNELKNNGYWVDSYFAFANWYFPCKGMRYADYLASRPSRLRNSIRRAKKSLSSIQDHKIYIVTSEGDSLEQAISDYCSVYSHSWKQAEPYPEFIPDLCRMAAHHGWLRLGVVKLDGKPVAAQIWIVKDDTALIFKLAYDEQYARLGVGTVLQATLSEYVLEQDRVSKIDFLSGDESYKSDWMSHRQERIGLIAFHPLTITGLFGATPHYLGRMWRRFIAKFQSKDAARASKDTVHRETLHHD